MSKHGRPKVARLKANHKKSVPPADLFRVVAESATDAIFGIDEQSTILFANKAAERIFGFTLAEMLHQPISMLMPAYLHEAHRTAVERYLQTGQKHEIGR